MRSSGGYANPAKGDYSIKGAICASCDRELTDAEAKAANVRSMRMSGAVQNARGAGQNQVAGLLDQADQLVTQMWRAQYGRWKFAKELLELTGKQEDVIPQLVHFGFNEAAIREFFLIGDPTGLFAHLGAEAGAKEKYAAEAGLRAQRLATYEAHERSLPAAAGGGGGGLLQLTAGTPVAPAQSASPSAQAVRDVTPPSRPPPLRSALIELADGSPVPVRRAHAVVEDIQDAEVVPIPTVAPPAVSADPEEARKARALAMFEQAQFWAAAASKEMAGESSGVALPGETPAVAVSAAAVLPTVMGDGAGTALTVGSQGQLIRSPAPAVSAPASSETQALAVRAPQPTGSALALGSLGRSAGLGVELSDRCKTCDVPVLKGVLMCNRCQRDNGLIAKDPRSAPPVPPPPGMIDPRTGQPGVVAMSISPSGQPMPVMALEDVTPEALAKWLA